MQQAEIEALARTHEDYVIGLRRLFHRHPEPSLKEFETARRIREELTRQGIAWQAVGGTTGTRVDIAGIQPGKTILLRADIDALSVTEATGLPFASETPGLMHACGHDCHIAMLLGAARILWGLRGRIRGCVRLVFQPAEELCKGSALMIENGILEGVDAAFGMHVWSDIPVGKISLLPGPMMAGADLFHIDVEGKATHGAMPEMGVDAAVASSAIVLALQSVVSRELPPREPVVVTVGKMEIGSRLNVVAGSGHMEGTTRFFSRGIGAQLPAILERVAQDTASAYRAQARVRYVRCVGPTVNDEALTRLAQGVAPDIFGPAWDAHYQSAMAAEDFSRYGEKVPCCFALVGAGNAACSACWPQHSDHYTVDESVLIRGTLMHVATALVFLESN